MRNKLIELIEEVLVEYVMPLNLRVRFLSGHIAEHLIANGVTIAEHGEWKKETMFIFTCSSCGADISSDAVWHKSGKLNYCPNCGANMTERKNDG